MARVGCLLLARRARGSFLPRRLFASRSLLSRLQAHAEAGRTVILSPNGKEQTYGELLRSASAIAGRIQSDPAYERNGRVAFLARPGFEYVCTLLGVWKAGGVAVPLCVTHPDDELRYAITEADACMVVASGGDLSERARNVSEARACFAVEELATANAYPDTGGACRHVETDLADPALIIFTSGTTGRPKGVVLTHGNLEAHTTSLVGAWGWSSNDRILHVLPLHHLHGLGNKLLCALWAGASIAFSSPSTREVWARLGRAQQDGLTLFMAVPTNYALLLREVDMLGEESDLIQEGCRGARSLRLMVSGSMALPTPVLERWRQLTGHTLLERYGMSELGMVLSNPLEGERVVGAVGTPLPGVQVQLRDPSTGERLKAGCEQGGDLLVRGPGVFREYFRRADATAEAFAPCYDGQGDWFRTGDHARLGEDGNYRILGRASVDVLKSAGYKISALEIERVLLEHEAVEEVAIVGVPDDAFGQRVGAIIVPTEVACV